MLTRKHPYLVNRTTLCFSSLLVAGIILFGLFFALTYPQSVNADLGDEYIPLGTDTAITRDIAWGDVDNDGDLDIVVAKGQGYLYLNTGSALELAPSWVSPYGGTSVAWGDVNNDGFLDLAVGRSVYLNQGGELSTNPIWQNPLNGGVVAWGDINKDGWVDLAIGEQVYLNEDGSLGSQAYWEPSSLLGRADALAWGDIDGDSYLDLVIVHDDKTRLFLNEQGSLSTTYAWSNCYPIYSDNCDPVEDIDLGDVDNDGDLDLAVVGWAGGDTGLYLNEGGVFGKYIPFDLSGNTQLSVGWGDMDNDGFLDLAIGTEYDYDVVLSNYQGQLGIPSWQSFFEPDNENLAWGDIDNDGDIDLAIVYYLGVPDVVFINEGGLEFQLTNEIVLGENAYNFSWVDVDNDADQDLIVASFSSIRLFLNDQGTLQSNPIWSYDEGFGIVSWGDMNADGFLDLAILKSSVFLVFTNNGGHLSDVPSWQIDAYTSGQLLAASWQDVNDDGFDDLSIGTVGGAYLFLSVGEVLESEPIWESLGPKVTTSIAWGDIDGDGDLDIAIGNAGHHELSCNCFTGEANQVFLNNEGVLGTYPIWESVDSLKATNSVIWGDIDGDGDLDLAVGNGAYNNPQVNQIYLTNDGMLDSQPAWESGDKKQTSDIDLKDINNDGALDLIIGNGQDPFWYDGEPETNQIFLNNGLLYDSSPSWESSELSLTLQIGVVDINLDGILDLVSLNSDENSLYVYEQIRLTNMKLPNNIPFIPYVRVPINEGNGLSQILADSIIPITYTLSDDEGEFTGLVETYYSLDGGGYWLPAIAASDTITYHLQTAYHTYTTTTLPLTDNGQTITSLAFGETDFIEQLNLSLTISHTDKAQLAGSLWVPWPTVEGTHIRLFDALGDLGDGLVDLKFHDQASSSITNSLSITTTVSGAYRPVGSLAILHGMPLTVPVTLYITDTVSGEVGTLERWSLRSHGVDHVFYWDTLASGFFGQSDNVVLRFVAHPQHGPYYRNPLSFTTTPFRVRGTQIRVFTDTITDSNKLTGAVVYRLPEGQLSAGEIMASLRGEPFRTNQEGYLPGRGEMYLGDRLIAMLPITATESYTVYHTSASPSLYGLDMYTVTTGGVQSLTISADNQLILFNLDVSLEWDAREDEAFLADLNNAFRRASEVLFDVSNGQVALGEVRVHHNRENWVASDVVIYASGSIRPRASMGGIATDLITDTNRFGEPIPAAYGPGQVRMGTVWDPFGENTAELTEDWWLALSHELAHYLLYLPDNYLGLDNNGAFTTIDCAGSFMTSTYDDTYSEFLTASEWMSDTVCANDTFAAHTTGRYDWATVINFYPMLFEPASRLDGPTILPLDLARLTIVPPTTGLSTTLPLPPRNIDLRDSVNDNGLLWLPSAHGYVFQRNGAGAEDDTLLPLGNANGDRLKVRGASPGDSLCLFAPYDELSGGAYFGCDDSYQATGSSVSLDLIPDWQPNIKVTAPNSTTLLITATLTSPVANLSVQLFPAYSSHLSPTAPIVSPVGTFTPLDGSNLVHVATLTTPYPLFEGHVHVYDSNEASRQTLLPFYLNPPWGPMNRPIDMGPNMRGWGANRRAINAPIASGDGAVTVYNRGDVFGETGTNSLQALNSLPNLPNWMTPVGQGYRFIADPTYTYSRTIAFDYLQRDVPPGYEYTLFIIYSPDEGATWERLVTNLDSADNLASAPMSNSNNGQGIYAIVSSLALPPLEAGWNAMVYPFASPRPVETVFESVASMLNRVCDSNGQTCYDALASQTHPEFAPYLNRFLEITPFSALQVNVSSAITPFIGIGDTPVPLNSISPPPATYYGWATPTAGFTPTLGMTVTAYVGAIPCGQTTLTNTIGLPSQLGFVLDVQTDAGDGCGNLAEVVSFQVNDWRMNHSQLWDNAYARYMVLDTVLVGADLAVSQEAFPNQPQLGQAVTYQIVVTNYGLVPATDVLLTDVLPAGTEFVSAAHLNGYCNEATGLVTCNLGTLQPDQSVSIIVTVIIVDGGLIANWVVVASTVYDPIESNNEDVLDIDVNVPTVISRVRGLLAQGELGLSLIVGWLAPAGFLTLTTILVIHRSRKTSD